MTDLDANGSGGPLDELVATVRAATAAIRGSAGESPAQLKVERSKREEQGDYSTNAAMLLAPVLSAPPREIAQRIGGELESALGADLDRWEVAGPGFVNLFMSDAWQRRALASILAAGDRYGAGGADPAERILAEFVSANPTGPLVAASGRHAAYGDALSRILEYHGHEALLSLAVTADSAGMTLRARTRPRPGFIPGAEVFVRVAGAVHTWPLAPAAASG